MAEIGKQPQGILYFWRNPNTCQRGRPIGAGRRDQSMLYDIALLRAADPTLEITPAVKQVVERSAIPMSTNVVRRVRNKYKEFEPMYGPVACHYLQAEPYDPDRHAGAPLGTLARVKQHTPEWADMSRNGWFPVEGWKDGEWIIRRDLSRILSDEEHLEQAARYFAAVLPNEIWGQLAEHFNINEI